MDWFERLTGFKESTGLDGYTRTQQRLWVDQRRLGSRVNGRTFEIGKLELLDLLTLRQRARAAKPVAGKLSLRVVQGDARELHAQADCAGAVFQVASQFNLLEMVGPDVTPEAGVTRYAHDLTQGPACAIAAGAATIFRNYCVPVGDAVGQAHNRQLDAFSDLGAAMAQALGRQPESLWTMRNGYALFSADAVERLSRHLNALDEAGRDAWRQKLKLGLHSDVEVTDSRASPGPLVSQAFCSALPVAYHAFAEASSVHWAGLATLVLESAYEATLWAAVINAQRGASRRVLLTLLGGGAFGNDQRWILGAMARALRVVRGHGLEVVLVSFRQPTPGLLRWASAQV